jgi:phosphonatase-like hydrolase
MRLLVAWGFPCSSMQNSIELVVLDMAGTTIRDDDSVNRCLRESLAADRIEVTREQVNEVMGLPKPIAIETLLQSKEGLSEAQRVRRIHDDFLQRMVTFYRTAPGVEPMPFAEQALTSLRRRGIKVFLDTGFSRRIVDAILERLGWKNGALIHGSVASDEVKRGRPHPDLVFRAMELCSISNPAAVAKVGDTPSDLQEGTAAACGLVIGVTNGSHTRAELLPHPHTHLIPTLENLPELVLNSMARST